MKRIRIKGRSYATVPAGQLRPGDRVISPEGTAYTVHRPHRGTALLVIGPNGSPYEWRRKATTGIPVDDETARRHATR